VPTKGCIANEHGGWTIEESKNWNILGWLGLEYFSQTFFFPFLLLHVIIVVLLQIPLWPALSPSFFFLSPFTFQGVCVCVCLFAVMKNQFSDLHS
jgi:hypothetical protein